MEVFISSAVITRFRKGGIIKLLKPASGVHILPQYKMARSGFFYIYKSNASFDENRKTSR